MRTVFLVLPLALTALGVSACGSKTSTESTSKPSSKDDDDKDTKHKKRDDDKDKDKDKDAKAKPSASAAEVPLASGSAPVAAPVTQPPNLPSGRSAVPTLAEWASAKEITVKGSSALGCETKIVREWFRVSCHGANDTGGTPTAVRVTRGSVDGATFVFVTGDIASLVFPWVDGTSLEAVFSWTDKSHKLVATWPHGSPDPEIKGVFEGAASPLDGTSPREPGDGVCECDYKQNGTTFCEPYMWGPNAGACETKYAGSCFKMLKCAVGDSSFPP